MAKVSESAKKEYYRRIKELKEEIESVNSR